MWSASFVLLGCPLKKPGESTDAAPEASASAAVEAAAPMAANDSDVTHYPDQAPGSNETLTTRVMVAARTEASTTGGKLVAELKPGTQTQKLADHEGFDLVVFPDPKDASNKLEGWVHATAFGGVTPVHVVDGGAVATDGGPTPVAVDAGTCKPLDLKKSGNACPAGYTTCGAACRLQCSKDADCCISGAVCSGGTCLGKGASPCAH